MEFSGKSRRPPTLGTHGLARDWRNAEDPSWPSNASSANTSQLNPAGALTASAAVQEHCNAPPFLFGAERLNKTVLYLAGSIRTYLRTNVHSANSSGSPTSLGSSPFEGQQVWPPTRSSRALLAE